MQALDLLARLVEFGPVELDLFTGDGRSRDLQRSILEGRTREVLRLLDYAPAFRYPVVIPERWRGRSQRRAASCNTGLPLASRGGPFVTRRGAQG